MDNVAFSHGDWLSDFSAAVLWNRWQENSIGDWRWCLSGYGTYFTAKEPEFGSPAPMWKLARCGDSGEWGQGILGLLAGLTSWISEFCVQQESLNTVERDQWRLWRPTCGLCKHTHTCMHAHQHTHDSPSTHANKIFIYTHVCICRIQGQQSTLKETRCRG